MRLLNSTLYSTIALSLLAGCSGNTAATPSAALPALQSTTAGVSTATTSGMVTVIVHNAFTHHDVNVDVQQFCGQPTEFGPMQPYNQLLGYGQANDDPQTGRVSGVLPPACFTGPANNVAIIYNEDDYQVTCTLAIAPRSAGGYSFAKTLQGPHADCSLVVTSPYAATFTFNATTSKEQLLDDF